MTATGIGLALILLCLCCGLTGVLKISKKLRYSSVVFGVAAVLYLAALIHVIGGM